MVFDDEWANYQYVNASIAYDLLLSGIAMKQVGWPDDMYLRRNVDF
jgi:hypothetical protein